MVLFFIHPFNEKVTATVVAPPVGHTKKVITNFKQDYEMKDKNHLTPVSRGILLPYLQPNNLVKRSPKPPLVPGLKIPAKFPIKFPVKKKKPIALPPLFWVTNPINVTPLCCDNIAYVLGSKPFKKPKKKSKPFKLALALDGPMTLKKSPLVKKGGLVPLASLTLATGPILPLKKGPVKKGSKALKTGSKLPPAVILKTSPKLALAPLKKVPKAAAPILSLGGKGAKVAKSLPAVLLASQSQGNGNQRRSNGRSGNQNRSGLRNGFSRSGEGDMTAVEEDITTRAPTEEEKEAVLEAQAALEGAQATLNQAQAALASLRGL